jgi:hypothetical protein
MVVLSIESVEVVQEIRSNTLIRTIQRLRYLMDKPSFVAYSVALLEQERVVKFSVVRSTIQPDS